MALYLDHNATSPMHPEVVHSDATQAVGIVGLGKTAQRAG